jgi:putative heme-binding domain-containing protein
MESARLLARARLTPAQLTALAPLVGAAGPIELREFLKLVRRLDAALAQTWADALVRSPVFGSLEESVIKSAFSVHPAALYERTLAPAIRAGAAAAEAKHRLLERLAANLGRGRVSAGENVFEFSACVACHHVGPLGRVLGPDLTHIGRIRQPRDLLESILFPDATIARDFETHAIETTDGQSILGVQQSAGESFVFVDLAGRETTLRPAQIATHTVLPTSLMPSGLEQTFNEQQLLDLVAWLAAQR